MSPRPAETSAGAMCSVGCFMSTRATCTCEPSHLGPRSVGLPAVPCGSLFGVAKGFRELQERLIDR